MFLGTSLAGTAAAFAMATPYAVTAAVTKAAREPFHGLKLGIASYSLRSFKLDQAIAMTRQAGLKYITLKDVHLSMKLSPAELQAAAKQVADGGLTLMGGGVVYMNNNEDEIRRAFEYAKAAGFPTIVCSPDPTALDKVEKAVKEFGQRIAIHNHGPGDKRYPSSLDVLRLVKDRDERMGICLDVGHAVRLGEDPLAVIRQCASRLYDFHIKDVSGAVADAKPARIGQGVIDIVGVLRALVELKFGYHVAIEYEADGDAPMPGILESANYMRGVLDTIP
jgi:sugar phosphate isomerase/epimerase